MGPTNDEPQLHPGRLSLPAAADVQLLRALAGPELQAQTQTETQTEGEAMSAPLAGVLDAIGAGPDLRRGLCVWSWHIFDEVDDPVIIDQAIALCRQCCVLGKCSEWVNSLPASKRPVGVTAAVLRRPA